MAGLFFDNTERQGRLKDLIASFNDIRQEMHDTIAEVTSESLELQKALELLQGQGKVASMQELEAKAKAQMSEEEFKEFKDLHDSLEKTDHDLWVAWQVMFWVDAGYASVMIPIEITSRIGAYMAARALNQAIEAAQVGAQIPIAARNLGNNGARAMRARAPGFHIPAGGPELARLQRLENFAEMMNKMSRIGKVVGMVLLAATVVLAVVDVIIQDGQRTELMQAIKDLFGMRHIIKQLAMAVKSEARHMTDARILLNERATKDDTLAGLVKDGIITAEKKQQLMAEYDAKKKAEVEAKSPKGGIPLPSDQDVFNVLKARDDLHKSWQKNDLDFPGLQHWLEEEAKKPHDPPKP